MSNPQELLNSNLQYFDNTFDSKENGILKIMYIHSGSKYCGKSDDYHCNLFESQLNLTMEFRFAHHFLFCFATLLLITCILSFVFADVCISRNDGKENITDLETSAILGLMLVGDPSHYDPCQPHEDEWATGPVIFKIYETLRLPKAFIISDVSGALGAFIVSHEIENEILGRRFVQKTIQGWRQKYGSKLSSLEAYIFVFFTE